MFMYVHGYIYGKREHNHRDTDNGDEKRIKIKKYDE